MTYQIYKSQVQLLLRILPFIAEEKVLALKGGTAINMFIFDMPRLSVDIDLTYIGFDDRITALANIAASISRIKNKLTAAINGSKIEATNSVSGHEEKLICWHNNAQVKVEVNTVMRGSIEPSRVMIVSEAVQKEFGLFAEMNILSEGELFGGKICAALDRQHPRDLFDVHFMLKNKGFTSEIKRGFIAALLSHTRPIYEILTPHIHDQKEVFSSQFEGMALKPFTYRDFEDTRENLITIIHSTLTETDKKFLASFKLGKPMWQLIDIGNLQQLPAVRWKLLNIQKLMQENPKKHLDLIKKLDGCFKMKVLS